MRVVRSALVAVLLLLAALIAVPASSASAASSPCVVSDILVNSCRPWLGATAGHAPNVASSFRAQIENHEQHIGRQLDIVHDYFLAGTLPVSSDDQYFINRPNTLMMINWRPSNVWADADGGNASVDSLIDQAADRFKAVAPHKVFLALNHEPENEVSAGNCTTDAASARGGSPADYRAMWRNVHDRFAARGVTNVVWVMDYMNWAPWDCLIDSLWPGDDLVDWVMFNGYGGKTYPNYVTNVSRFYDLLTAHSATGHDYLSKPWGIAEWSVRNATEAQGISYFNQAKAALDSNRFPRLKAFLAYDNVGADGNENRVGYLAGGTYDQAKQDAYTALAADPVFSDAGGGAADTTPPNATVTAPAAGATVRGQVSVSADVSDDTAVVSTDLQVDGQTVASAQPPPSGPALFSWNSASVPDGSHSLVVRASDGAGNAGTSVAVTVTVANGTDIGPPTAPTGLQAAVTKSYLVTLTWAAATDSGGPGVAGYRIYRKDLGTTPLATVGAGTLTLGDTRVAAATSYTYRVEAFDSSGNVGPQSAPVSVKTRNAGEHTPPTQPADLHGVTATATSISLAWTAAKDNWGVKGYHVYRDGSYAGDSTTPSFTDTGLAPGTLHQYWVVAFDSSANLSAPSATVTASTTS